MYSSNTGLFVLHRRGVVGEGVKDLCALFLKIEFFLPKNDYFSCFSKYDHGEGP